MIENMMIFSIFITVMITLMLLGLMFLGALSLLIDYIRFRRKSKMQERLDRIIDDIEIDRERSRQ